MALVPAAPPVTNLSTSKRHAAERAGGAAGALADTAGPCRTALWTSKSLVPPPQTPRAAAASPLQAAPLRAFFDFAKRGESVEGRLAVLHVGSAREAAAHIALLEVALCLGPRRYPTLLRHRYPSTLVEPRRLVTLSFCAEPRASHLPALALAARSCQCAQAALPLELERLASGGSPVQRLQRLPCTCAEALWRCALAAAGGVPSGVGRADRRHRQRACVGRGRGLAPHGHAPNLKSLAKNKSRSTGTKWGAGAGRPGAVAAALPCPPRPRRRPPGLLPSWPAPGTS
eukprot:1867957-Rhodomonas_salina.1